MNTKLSEITSIVQREMAEFENMFKNRFVCDNGLLNTMLAYTCSLKGKRVRPLLIFLIAKIFGKVTDQTYRSAVIIELLHTASLLHDDVIDNSQLRRKNQTVNALFGDKAAILCGDYLYGQALSAIKTQEDFNLMDVFARIALQLPLGEVEESDVTATKDVQINSYLNVIYYKTASLISAAAECGVRTCGNKDVDYLSIATLGQNIGMAFQIRDDILDYDENNSAGKGLGNDIREKKITLPFINYLQTLEGTKKEETVEFFFSDNKTQSDIENFISEVNKSGAVEKTYKMQKEYSDKALKEVDLMPLNDYSVNLRALVQYLTIRNQ
ncbi:MAG: polyprenyl synthetase family protein [Bacteroidales bacterium]|nr:polyprenyl synthetase family protein [Bacteroidales bacterium]